MSKSWNRIETWLALTVVAVGVLLAAFAGLHTYMTTTAETLHPDPQDVPSATHSSPSPQWADAVEQGRQVVRAGLSEQNLPGLSVAVGLGGEIVWAEGFGWADLEKRVPVEPATRFRIGTASNVLTSAAVGLLLEKGRLQLDDEIQALVREYPRQRWPVRLGQAMAHTAGVVTDGGDEGPLLAEHCARPVEGLRAFASRPLLFEPGTDYRYSSYGWILVSAAVEAAADQPFLSFMREHVFEPLAMEATRADSATVPLSDRATSYFPRYAAEPRYGLHLMREIDLSCYAGASVFLSTPSDLVRFGMSMGRGTLLQPATVERLQMSQQLHSGAETGYGLGWDLETVALADEPTPVVGHDGDLLGGMVASLMTFRNRGLVVAVTSNISYADTASLALQIAEAFADQRRR